MYLEEGVALQNEAQFETLIEDVILKGYGVCDNFLTEELIVSLRKKLLQYKEEGDMYRAGIGRVVNFQKDKSIRGDVIRWIDEEKCANENWLVYKIDQLINYLNRTCFTAINSSEFHYAYYEVNSFYKRHIDQFKSSSGRKFSLVIYLNEDWMPEDGGQLRLYLKDGIKDIVPKGGRAVFFKSDELEHEVLPSHNRFRISIAGWLRSDIPGVTDLAV